SDAGSSCQSTSRSEALGAATAGHRTRAAGGPTARTPAVPAHRRRPERERGSATATQRDPSDTMGSLSGTNAGVSDTTEPTASPPPPEASRGSAPATLGVGVIVWLASELMFFAGLFAAYFSLRAVNDPWPPDDV